MAVYNGSGNFVGIVAGSHGYYEDTLKGIFFGNKAGQYYENHIHCTVAPKYNYSSGGTITKNALEIESDFVEGEWVDEGDYVYLYHEPLYINFSNLSRLTINGYIGYTGSLTVASGVSVDSHYLCTTNYSTYNFYCGLLYSGV